MRSVPIKPRAVQRSTRLCNQAKFEPKLPRSILQDVKSVCRLTTAARKCWDTTVRAPELCTITGNVDQLERGDIVVFETSPKDAKYVETIRIQEPTQGARLARRSPLPPRADVIEGTVEKVQYDLGVFDVRSRTGRMVTVSIPYNAKPADVENFRRLRRGDYVRVEGEFVNSESLQLLTFLSPR